MIRVEQTILTPPDGNCFAACVASILELPLDEVPNYQSAEDGWWHEWQEWLAPRNLAFVGWNHPISDDERTVRDVLRGYSIVTVNYGELAHACVAFDGEVVWNPHPLRGTRQHDSIKDWIVIRVLDPSKFKQSEEEWEATNA